MPQITVKIKMSTSSLLFLCTWATFLSYNGVLGVLGGEGIIGGSDDDGPHEFPYLVSFENSTLDHWCGGAIIGDQFILTAAHCVVHEEVTFRDFPHKIVAGINDLNTDQDTKVVVEVQKIYVSEKYNHSWWFMKENALADWAVLKLKTKLDIENNPGLKIVDLPKKLEDTDEYDTYEGQKAVFAGFGYDYIEIYVDEEGNTRDRGNSSGLLHKAQVQVVNNTVCRKGYTAPVLDSQICAKIIEHDDGTPQGPCSGDSGSPLVIDNTVVGVMSVSGLACNDNNTPAMYTRVTTYIEDILNAMKDVTNGLRVATAS